MTASKVRTNVYLDSEMKAKAKEIFKHYIMKLSERLKMQELVSMEILLQWKS